MKKISLLCAGLAAMLVLALPVTPAWALNQISFVSGSGSDSNNTCNNPTAPCQSLSQAVANTINQGTVLCIGNGVQDTSIFNGTTISQSVTIDCGAANLISFGVLTINGPGIVVRLRNLSFDGSGHQPNYAISVVSAAEVHVENCRIHNITGSSPGVGINFSPSGSTRSRLVVADTVITQTGQSNLFASGILVAPSGSGLTQVVVERTRIEQGTSGIVVDGDNSTSQVQVEIKDSVIANNTIGVFAGSGSALTVASLSNSHVVANGTGVSASGSQAVVILDRTTIQASTFQAVTASNGGAAFSYGNNPINNNAALGTTPMVIGQH
jgi:hypothetical protein